jgi:hypothetical protein
LFYFLACLFPLGAWLFSLLDHFSLFLSCICSTSIILSFYLLFLIIQQIFLIVNSQTWHEYKKNIRMYNVGRGLQKNLKIVFGRQWYLVLFSPTISSQPVGDGMTFDMTLIETQRIGAKHN